MPVDDNSSRYPLALDAVLDRPSRGLWLVKWLLLIPHYVVLAVLMIGLSVVWVAALFAILFTGRYPRPLFDYTVGVLRWAWRVGAYGYGLAATDRYPPFTLSDVPDYPAHLDVAYPEHLSRGLVLVKWWLLAIPHYLIVGLLYGGVFTLSWRNGDTNTGWQGAGIIGLLVFVALLVLLIRGAYPQGLFDLIMGLQRWGARVGAYALLLTDEYPPFRLDLGGSEPRPEPRWPSTVEPGTLAEPGPAPVRAVPDRWTAGRLTALISGALLVLVSGGLLLGAGTTALADQAARDSDGYLMTGRTTVSAPGHAVTSEAFEVPLNGPDWTRPSWSLGTLRAQASTTDPERPLFLGVARSADVDRYLAGVPHSVVQGLDNGTPRYESVAGTAFPASPGDQSFWIHQAEGTGPLELTWSSDEPDWVLVVMGADGAAGVSATADLGATMPILGRVAGGLAIAGLALLLSGAALMIIAFRPAPAAGAVSPPPVRA